VRRLRRSLAPAALAAALAAAPAAAATGCPDADLAPAPESVPLVRDAIVCLLNRERAALDLPAVVANRRLGRAARAHSADMVARRYLAHEREGEPGVLARILATGYFAGARGGVFGENIGVAAEGRATPAELVAAWMASSHHRVNIVHRGFRDVGVGIVFAPADPAFYADWPSVVITTDFGRRDVRRHCRKVRRRAAADAQPRRWCRARR
jgi:uncharacterized protein YkwD